MAWAPRDRAVRTGAPLLRCVGTQPAGWRAARAAGCRPDDQEKTMTNIAVRKDTETRPAPTAPMAEWDPFRMMRQMFQWDPFREMAPMLRDDRSGFVPAFEVKETKDGYVFKADVPGIKDADLDITVTGNRLSVSGKRESEKEDKSDQYYAYERSYGSFTRSFTLPEGANAEQIRADLKDGVLTLAVPKKPEAQPKRIDIKPQATKS